MKGSTKIKITLIVLAVFLAITILPKYIMMLPWHDEQFLWFIITILFINEFLSGTLAIVAASDHKQWDTFFSYKRFSVTAWVVVGIKLLWKHGMKLADKHLSD